MSTIDPKMRVSDILKLYPETLPVFSDFGMKCAEDDSFAEKTLEENFIAEQINFMELLSQLNKVINPIKTSNSQASLSKKINFPFKDRQIELEVPTEIGDVVAQHTSVGEKFKITDFLGIWGYLGLVTLALFMIPVMYVSPWVGISIIFAVCLLFFALFYFKKENVVIIGADGFVTYKLSKQTQLVVSQELYLFKDVSDLVFPQTVNYMNGVYTGTSFKFCLSNGEKDIFEQSGKFKNLKGEEDKYGWKFLSLCGIENAWTAFLLDKFKQELNTQGFVLFKQELNTQGFMQFNSESDLTSNQIEIGNNYLKCDGKKFYKWDIKEISSHQGTLFIDHINYESKYLGLKTKGDRIIIPVNDMPNKKAFLILLNCLNINS